MPDGPDVVIHPVDVTSGVPSPIPPAAPSLVTRLNTHATGYVGVASGAVGLSAIGVAIKRVFDELSQGPFLLQLYEEHAQHTFGPATSNLVGLMFGVLGAIVLTAFGVGAAYLSRPRNIPE